MKIMKSDEGVNFMYDQYFAPPIVKNLKLFHYIVIDKDLELSKNITYFPWEGKYKIQHKGKVLRTLSGIEIYNPVKVEGFINFYNNIY